MHEVIKPVLVFYMSKDLTLERIRAIYNSIAPSVKEDYHVIIMHSDVETRIELLSVTGAKKESIKNLEKRLLNENTDSGATA